MRTLGTLLILFTRLPTAAAVAFSNKADLKAALERWCANDKSTVAADGPPGSWDVSLVTDLYRLMFNAEGDWTTHCRDTFNEVRARRGARLLSCLRAAAPPATTVHPRRGLPSDREPHRMRAADRLVGRQRGHVH